MDNLSAARRYMAEHAIDGWLLYAKDGNNPIFNKVAGTEEPISRCFLYVPREGSPSAIGYRADLEAITAFPVEKDPFKSWANVRNWLKTKLSGTSLVAMEYSVHGNVPAFSLVDAGTVELVKTCGPNVASSADLFGYAFCAWDKELLASHENAARNLETSLDVGLAAVKDSLKRNEPLTEYDLQQLIAKEFYRLGGEMPDGEPIVAVNANSRHPHYFPEPEGSALVAKDCWLLIDLWGRQKGESEVFADITWVAYTGTDLPEKHREIFTVVRDARDLVIKRAIDDWNQEKVTLGWQLDRVARDHISKKGYGDTFIHTTGHSLGPGTVHAPGVGLNSLSAHDTRTVLPGSGVTIEPGIYLPEFGMRTEIDVYVDPETGPRVTTRLQEKVTLIF